MVRKRRIERSRSVASSVGSVLSGSLINFRSGHENVGCFGRLLKFVRSFQFIFCFVLFVLLCFFTLSLVGILTYLGMTVFRQSVFTLEERAVAKLAEDLAYEIQKPYAFLGMAVNFVSEDIDRVLRIANDGEYYHLDQLSRSAVYQWEMRPDLSVVSTTGFVLENGWETLVGNFDEGYGLGYYSNHSELTIEFLAVSNENTGLETFHQYSMEYIPQSANKVTLIDQLYGSELTSFTDTNSSLRWSQPYWRDDYWDHAWITLFQPVFVNGSLFALCFADTSHSSWTGVLTAFSEALGSEYPDSFLYMFNVRTKLIFGYSGEAVQGYELHRADEHPSSLIRESYSKISGYVDTGTLYDATEPGKRVFVTRNRIMTTWEITEIVQLRDIFGLDCVVVAVLPLRESYKFVLRSALLSLGISVLFFVVFYVNLVSLMCCFMAPLRTINKRMNRVGEMEMDVDAWEINNRKFWFTEILSVYDNFMLMIKQLQKFKRFIPDGIFKKREKHLSEASTHDSSKGSDDSDSDSDDSDDEEDHNQKFPERRGSISSQIISSWHDLGTTLSRLLVVKIFCPNYGEDLAEPHPLIAKVLDRVHRFRAVILNVAPTYCVLVWNEYNCVPRALRFMIEMANAFKNYDDLVFSMASSVCRVGNIGNDVHRFYSCDGKAFDVVDDNYEIGKTLRCKTLVDDSIVLLLDELKRRNLFMLRMIDLQTKVWELGEEKIINPDEWMYELKQKETHEKWDVYNGAVKSFFKEDYEVGVVQMGEYVKENSSDEIAKNMFKKMKLKWSSL